MSFYPDAQPVASSFHQSDSGLAMHPSPPHNQPPHLAAAASAGASVYPYLDPSTQAHMYYRQSYSDAAPASLANGVDHHVWQAPQAPRLSAAAARAGRQHMMGYAPAAYAHTHAATPWYAQSLGYSQPYPQPRTHQQLEHQLLVQHQLAKAHQRQNGTSVYQSTFGPGSLSYPHHPHPPSHPHHPVPQPNYHQLTHAYPAGPSAAHDARDERQLRYCDGWASSGSHRAGRAAEASHDWSAWHHAAAAARGSVAFAPQRDQMYASQPMHDSHRHLVDATLDASAAWVPPHSNAAPSQPHGWDHASHYPQHSYADDCHAHAGYRDVVAHSRSRQEYLDHPAHFARSHDHSHEYAERARDERHSHSQMRSAYPDASQDRADNAQIHSEATHWHAQPNAHQGMKNEADACAAEQRDGAPAEGSTDQAAPAPAPCSPGSLEKSALPIAAIGAQLIWNACAALFDPELLVEAHETVDEAMDECDDATSPGAASMPSSSSTPSLNTPDISPWSSTVLDRTATNAASSGEWNAFRSPFGPDRLPQLRPQAHSFTFGSDHASSHHDLHRMAVGAERARSARARDVLPGKRSRQGSGHSDAATNHSSGASTASSSEPGTPASLTHASPALSSTISAHSIDTAHSPHRASLGMTLQGSRSDSAIRSHRNSSKTSPTLGSSKWSGRIRDNVLAVLRLVSPDWRWSNNDHLFVSLSETLPTATATATKPSHSQSQGRSGGRDSVTSIVTSYANEPSPAFRRFVHQVLAQTLLSPPAFLLGILNALRLLVTAQLPDGSVDAVVLELFAQPTSAAPFKLFTLGMMIANKHLDDNTFLNKTWNEVTGIPLAELNQTEAWFLKKCNYEVNVPDETWIGFLHRLQSWEEKRSSRGMHRDQDSSKRLLLVLDEALSHFDAIPALQLDGEVIAKPTSPMDMWTESHHRAGSLALADDVDDQICHSAPAMGVLPSRQDLRAASHKPRHVCRASLPMETPPATVLGPSLDFVVAGGQPFKDISPLSESGKSQNGAMPAPLMPSALLHSSRSLFHHGGGMFGPLATSS